MKLAYCAAGIMVCNLAWGYFQERVGATKYDGERFTAIPVMNLLQALFAALVGFFMTGAGSGARAEAAVAVEGGKPKRGRRPSVASTPRASSPLAPSPPVSVWDFLPVSLCHTIASPVGYMAMLFIPYPFYMCVSTAKFLPVLLMGWLVNGRTPTPAAALASALMLQGILLYSSETLSKTALVRSEEDPVVLFGVPLSPAFTVVAGVSVTLINLTMEGWTNASQDALRKRAGPEFKNYEFYLMAVMNAWSFVLLTVFLAVECALRGPASLLLTAISFAGRHPRILADIGAFAALGALAQIFIFTSISEHGSFSTTTITVSRKFLSVLVSVALFGHKLSFPQWVGVADVFAGLGTQMLYGSHGHGHGGEGKKVHKGLKTA